MQSQSFQKHDLVRVVTQPDMQFVKIQGMYAVITEIQDTHCTIAELRLTGRTDGGEGAVPLSCLEKPQNVPGVWRAAYVVYKQFAAGADADLEQEVKDTIKNTRRRKRAIRLVADKFSLDPKTIRVIMKDLEAAGVILIT